MSEVEKQQRVIPRELRELHQKFADNFEKLAIDCDDEVIDKFRSLAEEIVKYNNFYSMSFLLQYFHDNDEGYNGLDWLQESLQGIIEEFKNEIYVKGILSNLHLMLPHAKGWAIYLFNMMFSTENCKQLFIKNINLAKPEHLIKVFNRIDKIYGYEEYGYDPRIKEIRNKLLDREEIWIQEKIQK